MNEELRAGIAEATRLTRAGRVWEATALIQRVLQGAGAAAPAGVRSPQPAEAEDVIEGEFWVNEPARPADPAPRMRVRPISPATKPTPTPDPPPVRARVIVPPITPRPPLYSPPRGPASGGRFLSATYAGQDGARPYKLYVPSSYHGQALPLVVMLHGCTQTPDNFAAGTRMNRLAEEHSCLVAYPAQVPTANPSACWNWFAAANQRRDEGEPALIAGIVGQIAEGFAVDPRRIYVTGMSAGGAMAVILGMTYPERFAAVGCHSGLAYGAAHDLPSALAAMAHPKEIPSRVAHAVPGAPPGTPPVPLIVFHGDRDTTVHPRNADRLVAQWAACHEGVAPNARSAPKPRVTVQQGQAGGQSYSRATYHDPSGQIIIERWLIHGAGHGWSGGSPEGSFTNPQGPDAAREMLRFFLAHPRTEG